MVITEKVREEPH